MYFLKPQNRVNIGKNQAILTQNQLSWSHRKKSENPMHGKWPFSARKMHGKWPFSKANSKLDFSNSGWKMAIFQAWIFQIPGVKNGYFPVGVGVNHHFSSTILKSYCARVFLMHFYLNNNDDLKKFFDFMHFSGAAGPKTDKTGLKPRKCWFLMFYHY